MFFRLFCRRPQSAAISVALPSRSWHLQLLFAAEILAGQRILAGHQLSGTSPCTNTLPRRGFPRQVRYPRHNRPSRMVSSSCSTTITVFPRSRSRFSVASKFVIVALMQPDTRLIQNIQNAHQRRADLRCQPDPLAFAAGKRSGRTGKCQIVQPHTFQESQSCPDLLENSYRQSCDSFVRKRELI